MSAPDDIVTRLLAVAWLAEEGSEVTDLAATAAAEIERLRAEVERLIPFARLIAHAEPYTTIPMDPDDVLWDRVHPTVQEAADARTAVAAYEAARKEADRG